MAHVMHFNNLLFSVRCVSASQSFCHGRQKLSKTVLLVAVIVIMAPTGNHNTFCTLAKLS